MTTVLGIDPGLFGSFAVYDGSILMVYDMPIINIQRNSKNRNTLDRTALVHMVKQIAQVRVDACYLELVGGITGQSASAAFIFGKNCGLVEGVVAAQLIPINMVSPIKWRNALKVNAGKDGALAKARDLFPAEAKLFARKKDDGRADAALIAVYGYRMEQQNSGKQWEEAMS